MRPTHPRPTRPPRPVRPSACPMGQPSPPPSATPRGVPFRGFPFAARPSRARRPPRCPRTPPTAPSSTPPTAPTGAPFAKATGNSSSPHKAKTNPCAPASTTSATTPTNATTLPKTPPTPNASPPSKPPSKPKCDAPATPSHAPAARKPPCRKNRPLPNLSGQAWPLEAPEASDATGTDAGFSTGGCLLGRGVSRGGMRRVSIRGTAHPEKRLRSLIEKALSRPLRPRPHSTGFQQICKSYRQGRQREQKGNRGWRALAAVFRLPLAPAAHIHVGARGKPEA